MILSDARPGEDRFLIPALPGVLARHKVLVLLSVVAGLALGVAGYLGSPPRYLAESVLVLDSRRIQALPTEAVVSPLPQESPALRSEIDIIRSRMMALRVVANLQASGVEFPAEARPGGVSGVLAALLRGEKHQPEDAGASEPASKARRLLENLDVFNDGRSYTINISFQDEDPVFAAQVADAFADSYIGYQDRVQQQETLRVANWLGSKLDALRQRVEESEHAVEAFRQSAGLSEVDGSSLAGQEVLRLTDELARAEAVVAGAVARLDTARRLSTGDQVPALDEFLRSTTMAALLGQLASAERKLSALTSSGASKSEQIPQLQQEIADLHRQIAQGADVLVQSLDNEAAIARQKRDLLAGGLSAARSRLAKADRQTVKLAQLKREADVNRGVYESYLQRYKQAIEQQGVVTPEARLISSAEGDPTRVSPRLSNWLALGLALGVVFGLAGAVAQEFTASPSRTRERFQKLTGLAVLSELPRWRAIDSPEAAHAAQDSTHPLGRALGMLAAGLSPLRAKTRSLVLAFTAAGSREGITTAALASARYLAVSGLSVVLVDANLRRPDVARRLGVAPQRFLDEILKGADPTALLLKDPLSEARIIPARQGAVAPELLFQSKRFLAVVDDLRRHFDVVLIDTPDLASASDALHFAAAADHSVLIVHPQRNRPADTLAALAGLSAVGRTPLGLIINAIPMGRISGAWARSRAAGTPGDGQHRHGSFGGQVEASLNS